MKDTKEIPDHSYSELVTTEIGCELAPKCYRGALIYGNVLYLSLSFFERSDGGIEYITTSTGFSGLFLLTYICRSPGHIGDQSRLSTVIHFLPCGRITPSTSILTFVPCAMIRITAAQ